MRLLYTIVFLVFAGTAFAAGGGSGSIKSLDFLFRTINFVVLFGGIGYLLSKPLKNYLKSRSENVRNAIAEAKKAKEEAEQKARYYEEKLAKLETEINEMMATFRKEADEDKERIIKDSQDQIVKVKERIEKSLEQERLRIRQEVMIEAAQMAIKVAEEFVKKNFSSADQKKWVQDYIKMMERTH